MLAFFKLKRFTYKNAINLVKREVYLPIVKDRKEEEQLRILFMSDFHIDILPEMKDKIISQLKDESYDLCIFGGDYRFNSHGAADISAGIMRDIIDVIKKESDIAAVLGNHDEYEFAEFLDGLGVTILLNESININIRNNNLVLCGIDDAGYFGAHDIEEACREVDIESKDKIKIFISHTPDVYKDAADKNFNLFLAGHTHGGQLCLPGGIPVLTETTAPRKMVNGTWLYNNMYGYTTAGIGCSGMPGRMFCPPEIVFINI